MANMLSPDKEKVTYAEFSEVRDELVRRRKKMSEEMGHEISEAEFYRILTLREANKSLRARGKPELNLDPSSTPGGTPSGKVASPPTFIRRRRA